jgi:hypothetical protein
MYVHSAEVRLSTPVYLKSRTLWQQLSVLTCYLNYVTPRTRAIYSILSPPQEYRKVCKYEEGEVQLWSTPTELQMQLTWNTGQNDLCDLYKIIKNIFLLEVSGSHSGMKMTVFWVVASCSSVEGYRRFRGACRLYHQGTDGGSKHLWKVGNLLPDFTAQQPRRQSSSYFSSFLPCLLFPSFFLCFETKHAISLSRSLTMRPRTWCYVCHFPTQLRVLLHCGTMYLYVNTNDLSRASNPIQKGSDTTDRCIGLYCVYTLKAVYFLSSPCSFVWNSVFRLGRCTRGVIPFFCHLRQLKGVAVLGCLARRDMSAPWWRGRGESSAVSDVYPWQERTKEQTGQIYHQQQGAVNIVQALW